MLSKAASSTIFFWVFVWLDLGLNPGLLDHWRTLNSLGQWMYPKNILNTYTLRALYMNVNIYLCVRVCVYKPLCTSRMYHRVNFFQSLPSPRSVCHSSFKESVLTISGGRISISGEYLYLEEESGGISISGGRIWRNIYIWRKNLEEYLYLEEESGGISISGGRIWREYLYLEEESGGISISGGRIIGIIPLPRV